MRIVQVLHGWPAPKMGGTGLYVDALARELAAQGHVVAIAAPGPGTETSRVSIEAGVETWQIATPTMRRWRDTWDQSNDAWSKWMGEWSPDVVHFHHLSGFPLSMVTESSCRTILTLHDYAVPCARGQLVTADLTPCDGPSPTRCSTCLGPALRSGPLAAAVGRILKRTPSIYKAARRHIERAPARPHPDVADRIRAAELALEAADVLLSPSADLARRFAGLGLRAPELTRLPLLNRPAAPSPKTSSGPVRFLFASSIIPTKGPDRVIEAFSKLEGSATLTVAGHAPPFDGHPGFGEATKRLADTLPGVEWLGAIPSAEVPAIMSNHDVLVLPSIWPENSPLVVREATAAGMHVIASKVGGVSELDPEATLVESSEDLLQAMQSAVVQGRQRRPTVEWPTVQAHTETLLTDVYR